MTNLSELPDRQRQVLHFIVRYIDEHEQSPTLGEIGDALDPKMTKQQVDQVLAVLVKKKRITRDRHQQRSIKLVEA